MKDIVLAVLIVVALVAGFSVHGSRTEMTTIPKGYGTEIQGDDGMVIPGDGTKLVTATMPPESETVRDEPCAESEFEPVAPQVRVDIIEKEMKIHMSEIIVSFWHGVAGVLLGEAVAVLIALAWSKIWKGW